MITRTIDPHNIFIEGRSESSQREWSRWGSSDMDGQTREGETSGKKANQAVRDGTSEARRAKRGGRRELGSSSQWCIMAHGDTREEAARQIQLAIEGALETAAVSGVNPPAPASAHAL